MSMTAPEAEVSVPEAVPPELPDRRRMLRPSGSVALFSRAGLVAAAVAAIRAAVAGAAATRSESLAPLSRDRDKIAHLLRRAGFGYSPDELDFYTGLGLPGAVDYLLTYEQVQDDVDDRLAALTFDFTKLGDMQRWWLLRMIYTKRPLLEKMVLFWHGLLTSATSKVGLPRPTPEIPNPPNLMLDQNQFFRQHALDDFGTILKGISRNPAMMVWLDSQVNRKGQPNENYARELMELFSLGIYGPDGQPNYTEQDVREIARAFTGWTLNKERAFAFNRGAHDDGPKTVFGQTGSWNGDDVIDLILAHPSCAWHTCTKLWEFFAYDQPEPQVLQPLIDTFKATGGSIKAVMRALLTSPAFYSERAYRAKVKSPAELVAGIARTLGLQTDAFGFETSTQRMGQALFNPPNVAGWPGGVLWFTSTTWLERVNQVNRLLSIRKDPHTQPVNLLGMVQRFGLDTPEKVVDYFVQLLLDGQVTAAQRQTLVSYVRDGNLWPQPGRPLKETDPAIDRKVRGLLYLLLSMPEYQLA
jgi:uncharacterized protein (DUF1800 family)